MAEVLVRDLKPLTRRLLTNTDLTESDIAELESLPIVIKDLPRHHDIVVQGDRTSRSCALLSGWLYRYRIIGDGGRQIMSFHLPGEIPDLHSLHLGEMDHALATLTPCRVGYIAHKDIDALTARNPRIANALWRDTLIDAGIFREWMVGIGRRLAFARVAHLLCEIYGRLAAIGLAGDDRMDWPVTQADLADATGMTAIHVNRTLRDLRKRQLVTIQEGVATIHDRQVLARVASFDPAYLHLRQA